MTKKFISLLLIITLSGCAHQLFENDDAPDQNKLVEPNNITPVKSGVPTVPYKRVSKNPSGDAYND